MEPIKMTDYNPEVKKALFDLDQSWMKITDGPLGVFQKQYNDALQQLLEKVLKSVLNRNPIVSDNEKVTFISNNPDVVVVQYCGKTLGIIITESIYTDSFKVNLTFEPVIPEL